MDGVEKGLKCSRESKTEKKKFKIETGGEVKTFTV